VGIQTLDEEPLAGYPLVLDQLRSHWQGIEADIQTEGSGEVHLAKDETEGGHHFAVEKY
jgi:hypothetical protein